jgi:hypothetical protein
MPCSICTGAVQTIFGLGPIKDAFPEAKVIALPEVATTEAMYSLMNHIPLPVRSMQKKENSGSRMLKCLKS